MPEYRLRYEGGVATVGALAQMLREEGVEVAYEAPEERRSTGEVVEAVVVQIVATGAIEAIRAGVRRFRERFTRSTVEIEGDDSQGET